jgi:hypothetical protein
MTALLHQFMSHARKGGLLMRRIVLVLAVLVLGYLIACAIVNAKGKKVKVYVEVPDGVNCEMFGYQVRQWMHIKDNENDSFEFDWVKEAEDATYIITVFIVKDSESCKYATAVQLHKKGSEKTFDRMNLQINCDIDAIAQKVVEDLEIPMGLAKPDTLTRR